jgi:hypothetical protein
MPILRYTAIQAYFRRIHYSVLTLVITFVCSASSTHAASERPFCRSTQKSLTSSSTHYPTLDQWAELQVYYGSIEGYKTSPIFNLVLTQTCESAGMKGFIYRFQTWAKPTRRSKTKLYYCYAKMVEIPSGFRKNNGTFCSLSLDSTLNNSETSTIEFTYDQPSDPYSIHHTSSSDSPDYSQLQNEFNHSLNIGLDRGFDPFFDTRTQSDHGPDSRSGSPDL